MEGRSVLTSRSSSQHAINWLDCTKSIRGVAIHGGIIVRRQPCFSRRSHRQNPRSTPARAGTIFPLAAAGQQPPPNNTAHTPRIHNLGGLVASSEEPCTTLRPLFCQRRVCRATSQLALQPRSRKRRDEPSTSRRVACVAASCAWTDTAAATRAGPETTCASVRVGQPPLLSLLRPALRHQAAI